jgi:hypothetical protein
MHTYIAEDTYAHTYIHTYIHTHIQGNGAVDIMKKEAKDSLQSEREYESALRDALKNGALPNRPA